MIESLLIAVAGGAAGLLIAEAAVQVFSTIQVPGDIPIQFSFELDHRVLGFALLVAAVSALLFGLAPAIQSTKTDLIPALKTGDSNDARKRFFGRNALVICQIGGSLVLLVASTQLYRAFTYV